MKVWWSTSPQPGNFGDVITPFILNHYGFDVRWSTRGQCDAISTGSIVSHARAGVYVLGSGAISRGDRINACARYRWVRGPITRELVIKAGGECPEVYGDPVFLLPMVIQRTVAPDREMGIVPHYVDFTQGKGDISPLLPPMTFLRELWRCHSIVSSSLHGIITAHAYGIPAAWVKMSDKLSGDDTKFHDYAQSVGMDHLPLSNGKLQFTLPQIDTSAMEKAIVQFRDEYMRTQVGR